MSEIVNTTIGWAANSTVGQTTTVSGVKVWTQTELEGLIPTFGIYTAQGVLLILTNGPILLTVLRHQTLREQKGYVVTAGLAFTDMVNGIAALTAGIGRITMILRGEALTQLTPWQCAWKPWNMLWYWVNPLVGVMMATVSLDRLLAVAIPLKYRQVLHQLSYLRYGLEGNTGLTYYTFTNRYALKLVGVTMLYVWGSSFVGLAMTYYGDNHTPKYPGICYTNWAIDESYLPYQYFMRVGGGIASILIYVAVYFAVMYRAKKRQGKKPVTSVAPTRTKSGNAPTNQSVWVNSEERKRWNAQLRLTITVGISTFFTFILFVVPYSMEIIASQMGNMSNLTFIIPYVYNMNNINAMLNFFIYTFRHNDLRIGFMYLVKGKRLTQASLM